MLANINTPQPSFKGTMILPYGQSDFYDFRRYSKTGKLGGARNIALANFKRKLAKNAQYDLKYVADERFVSNKTNMIDVHPSGSTYYLVKRFYDTGETPLSRKVKTLYEGYENKNFIGKSLTALKKFFITLKAHLLAQQSLLPENMLDALKYAKDLSKIDKKREIGETCLKSLLKRCSKKLL